jgi:hypothetical protein
MQKTERMFVLTKCTIGQNKYVHEDNNDLYFKLQLNA